MQWKLKKFNELELDELYEILALRSEIFVVEQECPYQDCDGKDRKSQHLFLEDNGQIVACLRIIEKGVSFDEFSIGRIVVKKEYRGKNIAREMISKAIKFIEEEWHGDRIKIQAQSYLLNFYKSFGFKEISEEYLEDNIPHTDMEYIKKL